jgi:glutamyl-tRNA synthetase
MSSSVVTRFAPSPTGYLHIGGARTALFNWLYARHHGGKMLLRIEDTDRARSTQEAIEAIIEGLKWLGLDWDCDVVFQFARAGRHAAVVQDMLKNGKAYYCYTTPEELEQMRELARAEGRTPRYDGRWRDRDPSDAPAGVKPVVRLKAEREGTTVVDDAVQGRVSWANKDLDDLVLLRSDGTPTYMLSVVVDDFDMGVSHIIRGDDHLTNAARQVQIYQAMGWDVPQMAHIPLIHGPDGAKLSKRHGALGIEAYRDMGYLPAALRNYLARLGWSHGDQEFFTTDELIEAFSLEHIGRSPSRIDFPKMAHVNAHYMRGASDDDLVLALQNILPFLEGGEAVLNWLKSGGRAAFVALLPSLRERSSTLLDLIEATRFLRDQRPLNMDEKASKLLAEKASNLSGLIDILKALNVWDVAHIEACVRDFVTAHGLKLGDVAQPMRAALIGTLVSPPVFDVAAVLGQEEVIARLSDCVKPS